MNELAKTDLVYIATRLENTEKYFEVREMLKKLDVGISYDWTTHGPVWKSGVHRIREVSLMELKGVADADYCIVILPGGRGTHCELGMALALGKQVFILAENRQEQLMQCAVPETCAFYHHPAVVWTFGVNHLMSYCQKIKEKKHG